MPAPTDPPPVSASVALPRAKPPEPFTFEPMPAGSRPWAALDALLKRPGQLIYQFHHAAADREIRLLLAVTLLCLALYGLTVGSFSGGAQWWAAPAKIVLGSILSALICLPSLYIFACLGGADIRLRPLCGVFAAVLCLNALLLIGFAPVAWVFTQSTDSAPFLGGLHLAFWTVSALFALRLFAALFAFLGARERGYLRLWCLIFLLVCLQMTTALRPILGKAETFLPAKKLFFLSHWGKNLSGEAE